MALAIDAQVNVFFMSGSEKQSGITISVITVSYNAYPFIMDTLDSVASQSWSRVEHIVVDGGSNDGTVRELQRHSASIARWISESDKGIYHAMNRGIRMASGEVVGFLNADDIYAHQGVLAEIAACFAESSVDACYGDLVYVRPDNPDHVVRYCRPGPFRPGLFARGWIPPHPTFYARRNVYERFGGFDLTYPIGNDIELMMRFLERYMLNVRYLPGIMVKMRTGGLSNRSTANIVRQNIEIMRAARHNNIRISPVSFLFFKFFSRAAQYMSRPRSGEAL